MQWRVALGGLPLRTAENLSRSTGTGRGNGVPALRRWDGGTDAPGVRTDPTDATLLRETRRILEIGGHVSCTTQKPSGLPCDRSECMKARAVGLDSVRKFNLRRESIFSLHAIPGFLSDATLLQENRDGHVTGCHVLRRHKNHRAWLAAVGACRARHKEGAC